MDYFIHTSPGLLQFTGQTRLDFLQRQTSNDLNALSSGKTIQTVLTSPTGRILDVLTVWQAGEALHALTLNGRGSATASFLKSRIFFMDQVNLVDLSEECAQIELLDDQLPGKLGWDQPDPGQVIDIDNGWLIGNGGLTDFGTRLIVRLESRDIIQSRLIDLGSDLLTPEGYSLERITRGLPGPEAELIDAYTPLEMGLASLVAENKGCYTGQEVLARQVNYDKITRQLTGISLADLALVGSPVLVVGKPVGEVTSSIQSPRLGPIALAVLRRPHHQPGTEVSVEGVSGKVVSLPFES